ncbi:MAG: molybdopterin-binding protein, partial [Vicinamibacteria bacterium]
MKFGPVPLDEAEGRILGHNVAGPDGRRLLRKGKALRQEDIESLRKLGRRTVYVAELEGGDVEENRAAERIGRAAIGPGLRLSGPSTGRVNLISTVLGVFRFAPERLGALNAEEGVTIASLAAHAVARPGQTVATVKVIPYAVPEEEVARAEAIARDRGPLLSVDALARRRVGLVLSGSPSVRMQLAESFTPLVERVAALGSEVVEQAYVTLEDENGEEALAETLR